LWTKNQICIFQSRGLLLCQTQVTARRADVAVDACGSAAAAGGKPGKLITLF